MTSGRIVLAATPIGNLGDASARLRELLAEADVVAAEDTRMARRLCQGLGVEPAGRFMAHHEHNEEASAQGLLERVRAGEMVAFVCGAADSAFRDVVEFNDRTTLAALCMRSSALSVGGFPNSSMRGLDVLACACPWRWDGGGAPRVYEVQATCG